MDRKAFFAALRRRGSGVFGTSLKQTQVDGIEALLAEGHSRSAPLPQLAYILATAYHETAHTMQPVAEIGKGKGKPYGKPGKYGQPQYGRGFVQLTWDRNYERADQELGLNGALLKDFDLAMEPAIAVKILFLGMEEGWFTGKKLSTYISGNKKDYVGARRVVNGTDKVQLIAGYARAFEKALSEAGYAADEEKPAPAAPAAVSKLSTAKTDSVTVEVIQRKLYELGYTEVGSKRADGTFDGKLGDMTRAAILIFRADNGLPKSDTIDQQFLDTLDTAPKRKLARNDAPAELVRQTVPEVRSNWLMKIGAFVVGIPAAVGSFFDGILGNLGLARGYIDPLKDGFSDIPSWIWFSLVVVIAGGTYLIARHGERKGVEAYQAGERR